MDVGCCWLVLLKKTYYLGSNFNIMEYLSALK
ncbi:MAG: hypothetical protein K0Q79_1913 [Flavipsychrobacter sp.]|jgi:hypothetical protein|nr:hypothetical protein [Flavipsychrobacter sp.]